MARIVSYCTKNKQYWGTMLLNTDKRRDDWPELGLVKSCCMDLSEHVIPHGQLSARQNFEKKTIFFMKIWWWWWVIVDLDHVDNVSHISAKKYLKYKNHVTVGKKFSSPAKPDQAGIFIFIRLEVMAWQRKPSLWWLWNVRQFFSKLVLWLSFCH